MSDIKNLATLGDELVEAVRSAIEFRATWMGLIFDEMRKAGDTIFLQGQASTVVVSISSASPFASFPITLAEAGAASTTSACFASATCSTLYWKFRSKVSIRHLFPVRLSKVMGLMNRVAFSVISTCTLQFIFLSILATFAIL